MDIVERWKGLGKQSREHGWLLRSGLRAESAWRALTSKHKTI